MSNSLTKDNANWWTSKSDQVSSNVHSYLAALDRNQSYLSIQNLKFFRLYGNNDNLMMRGYNYTRSESSYATANRVTMNVVQSMIDTVVSKITKNKPKPMFLTEGGDWSLQRKAKKLTQFIEGQFYSTDFYAKAAVAFLHSCIFGTGAIKIFRDGDKIHAEHVFIDELKVDDSDGVYGAPRQLHQKKFVNRDVLINMFPDSEVYINMIGQDTEEYINYKPQYQLDGDMIQVVESWHLPSGSDADDGRHVITIQNHTLLDEEYKKDYFPFVFFRWGLRPLGFWGQGIAEQLQGVQLEINKILRTIQVSMHLISIPKIFVEASSKIVSAHLNNKIGGIVKYAGQPPTPGNLGSIPPELFSHLDRLYSKCYEIIGVSQLSATAAKPAGLNSGKALRIYNDIETERFMSVGQRYEQAFLDASKQFIDLAREIDEESKEQGTKGLEVKVKTGKFMESIKWKDVDLDADKYLMQMFPTSSLASTPSGRLQDVQDLLQAGFIAKEDAMKLLNFPDLEGFYNMTNAGLEDIERQIEMMIEHGEYETPEPYQNLQLGIEKMQQAYLMYRSQNCPDDKLDLLRRWMADADALLQRANQSQQAQAAAAQQASMLSQANTGMMTPQSGTNEPIAQAAPQPVSDMLPVNGAPVPQS
jgi:hypothetical protein